MVEMHRKDCLQIQNLPRKEKEKQREKEDKCNAEEEKDGCSGGTLKRGETAGGGTGNCSKDVFQCHLFDDIRLRNHSSEFRKA